VRREVHAPYSEARADPATQNDASALNIIIEANGVFAAAISR
jgi:hypothetical protein